MLNPRNIVTDPLQSSHLRGTTARPVICSVDVPRTNAPGQTPPDNQRLGSVRAVRSSRTTQSDDGLAGVHNAFLRLRILYHKPV